MRNYANLMSEKAQFLAAARLRIRRWCVAVGTLGAVLLVLATERYFQCRQVHREQEALEARYEPIRQLNLINRTLATDAAELVNREGIALELARRPPVASLLGLVADVAKTSNGKLYVQRFNLTSIDSNDGKPSAASGRFLIEAFSTVKYDVANLVDALKRSPFSAVKVLSADVVSQEGGDRRKYAIECLY